MKNKIIAVVKFNSGEAFVMKNPIKLEYTKYGSDTIIGTNGYILQCYGYSREYDKAFAGTEFDLKLVDGTTEHCNGQWWDSITKRAREEIDGNIISVTANNIERLKKCYVFNGYCGTEKEIEKLRSEYQGKVYEYYEYEKIIKEDNK